jgi:hypothetical protein
LDFNHRCSIMIQSLTYLSHMEVHLNGYHMSLMSAGINDTVNFDPFSSQQERSNHRYGWQR